MDRDEFEDYYDNHAHDHDEENREAAEAMDMSDVFDEQRRY